jgi:hypothetical protein
MNIGGSGKNAVGADFIEFTNGIDLLTREYERVRIRQLDSLKGTAAVWKWALRRQGVEGIYMICSAAQVMADLRAR